MEQGIDRPLSDLIRAALEEDIGSGDITSEALVAPTLVARGTIVQKATGIAFGYQVARAVFNQVDPGISWRELAEEGVHRTRREQLVEVEGPARSILAAERVALNFLQHLSGIATLTAKFVEAVAGTGTEILDTRKTMPGLRRWEKEAVRAGGGTNHRLGLYDAVLIKGNHIAMVGSAGKAVRRALDNLDEGAIVEVECSSLEDVEEAVEANAHRILLDNMYPDELSKAAELVAGRAELEASGGVELDTVREIAASPVQYVSVGALTHSAPALDLSLQLRVI